MRSGKRLAALVEAARQEGWAPSRRQLSELLAEAIAEGVEVSPTRAGEGPIGMLRAVESSAAHPQSLSAIYGLGRLPLHTDGAHQRRPPSVVILEADGARLGDATLVWIADHATATSAVKTALRQGVFTVGRGRSAFLAHALDTDGRVRFDPGCMRPADDLARRAAMWFDRMRDEATPFCWAREARCVVIDNTRCLHGRPGGVRQGRELRRLMLNWPLDAEPC